jgi:hypothetical protein
VDTRLHAAPEHSLRALSVELETRSRQLILATGLVFAVPPTIDEPTPELSTMDPNDLRLHKLSLNPNEPVNIPVSEYEKWLLTAKNKVLLDTADDVSSDRLLVDLEKEFRRLQRHKVDEWRRLQEGVRLRRRLETFSGSLVRPAVCASVETGMCFESFPQVGTYAPPQPIFLAGVPFLLTS